MRAGVYEIVDRGGRKTSFAYKLEIPQELGEVQQELQIKKEASYTLSMKVLWCLWQCSTLVCWLCLDTMALCAFSSSSWTVQSSVVKQPERC